MNTRLVYSYVALLCLITAHSQLLCNETIQETKKQTLKTTDFPQYCKEWEDRSKGPFCTKVLSNTGNSAVKLFTKETYLSDDIYVQDGPKANGWLSGLFVWLGLRSQEYNYHFKANGYCTDSATPFKHETITTEDGFKLEAFVRNVPNPKFTIVINSGFLPGIMYGMLSLVPMLPKDCNMVFYNNRGKGKSEGSLDPKSLQGLKSLQSYGQDEYLDAAAALKFAHELDTNAPIVAYGVCAGAFHLEKALCKMGPQLVKAYNICGVFYDSAVTSIQKTLINLPHYKYPSGWLAPIQRAFLWLLRYTAFREDTMASKTHTDLDPIQFCSMQIPTHHLYAEHDQLTKAETIEKHIKDHGIEDACTTTKLTMREKSQDKPVTHANGILQCKKQYSEVLAHWICTQVNKFNSEKSLQE